jgi:hypothetical protein
MVIQKETADTHTRVSRWVLNELKKLKIDSNETPNGVIERLIVFSKDNGGLNK